MRFGPRSDHKDRSPQRKQGLWCGPKTLACAAGSDPIFYSKGSTVPLTRGNSGNIRANAAAGRNKKLE
jgi:hypothetical protein